MIANQKLLNVSCILTMKIPLLNLGSCIVCLRTDKASYINIWLDEDLVPCCGIGLDILCLLALGVVSDGVGVEVCFCKTSTRIDYDVKFSS